ncbi:MAG: ATP-binding protein, partial [Pseudomonadota bacterium]
MLDNLNNDDVSRLVSNYFSPSASIRSPERLIGREKYLRRIRRAIASPGRQIFIHGERGVGKSSIALTAGYEHNVSRYEPILLTCGENTSFESLIRSLGREVVDVEKRFQSTGRETTAGFNLPEIGAVFSHKPGPPIDISEPKTIADALEIVRFVESARSSPTIVIVDEFERIASEAERKKFAEFIKAIPELETQIRFIFCGIGASVDELLGAHPSAGRVIETIEVEKLNHDYLWQIITTVTDSVSVNISEDFLKRVSMLSDGFPHYIHLIGEQLLWSFFDDPDVVTDCSTMHMRSSVKGALERAEHVLRQAYTRATEKTKHTRTYEHALWCLAHNNSTRRQLGEIFDNSYQKLARALRLDDDQVLTREAFGRRLWALSKDSHGAIVKAHGSGWYSLRENVLRGYIRLV